MHPVSSLTSFVVSGLLAASATLFVGWPSIVDAEAPEVEAAEAASATAQAVNAPANAELRANESKIGDLIVSAELSDAGQGRTVRLECRNPTATLIAGNVHVELGRNDGIPMGRVESSPTIVWRHDEAVKVGAGETLVRTLSLPKQFTQEMNRLAKLATAAGQNPDIAVPNVYYTAMAFPVVPGSPQRSRNNRMARSPLSDQDMPAPQAQVQSRANSKTAMVGSDLRY